MENRRLLRDTCLDDSILWSTQLRHGENAHRSYLPSNSFQCINGYTPQGSKTTGFGDSYTYIVHTKQDSKEMYEYEWILAPHAANRVN